eukprot:2837322-Rhodomonas_salina.1
MLGSEKVTVCAKFEVCAKFDFEELGLRLGSNMTIDSMPFSEKDAEWASDADRERARLHAAWALDFTTDGVEQADRAADELPNEAGLQGVDDSEASFVGNESAPEDGDTGIDDGDCDLDEDPDDGELDLNIPGFQTVDKVEARWQLQRVSQANREECGTHLKFVASWGLECADGDSERLVTVAGGSGCGGEEVFAELRKHRWQYRDVARVKFIKFSPNQRWPRAKGGTDIDMPVLRLRLLEEIIQWPSPPGAPGHGLQGP